MYRVLLDDAQILNPPENLLLESPTLTLADNEAGSFSFKIYPDHPNYKDVAVMRNDVNVYWEDELLFTGRVVATQKDFYRGLSVECEGDLALLDDTVLPAATIGPIPVETALATILASHNLICDESRKFKLGEVTVDGKVSLDTNWQSPLQVIKEQVVGQLGGHIRVRQGRYIDYLKDYPRTSDQQIIFGENLLDYMEDLDGRDIVTTVYPYGKDGLDISSVYSSKFISSGLEPIYGRIFKAVEFSDIEDAQELYDAAVNWMHIHATEKVSLSLTAVDLADMGLSADHFRHLDMVQCYSKAHNLDRKLPITELSINLLDASQNTYTLGWSGEEFSQTVQKTTVTNSSEGKSYDTDIQDLKNKNSDQDQSIKDLQSSDSKQNSTIEELQASQKEQDQKIKALEERPGGGEMGDTGHVWIQPSLQQPNEFYITEAESLAGDGHAFKWTGDHGLQHGINGDYFNPPLIDKTGFVNLTGNIQGSGENTAYSLNSGLIVSSGPSTMTIKGGELSSYRVNPQNQDTSAAFVNDSVIASDYWKGNSVNNVRTHLEIGDGKITGFSDISGRFVTGASDKYGYLQFYPYDDTVENVHKQTCGLTINGETLNLQVDNIRICESQTKATYAYGLTGSITVGSGYFGYQGGKIVQYPITLHFSKGLLRKIDFGGSLEPFLTPSRKIRGFDASTLTLWEDE